MWPILSKRALPGFDSRRLRASRPACGEGVGAGAGRPAIRLPALPAQSPGPRAPLNWAATNSLARRHRPPFPVLASLSDKRWCPHFTDKEADARRVSISRLPRQEGPRQQAGTQARLETRWRACPDPHASTPRQASAATCPVAPRDHKHRQAEGWLPRARQLLRCPLDPE